MKRTWTLLAVALLALSLAGCDSAVTEDTTDTPAADTATSSASILEGLDAMPTDGANESVALEVVGTAFAAEKKKDTWAGVDFTALEAAGPTFVAYLVEVEMGGQVALFEVRADGVAHNIYSYQRAFDSGSTIWSAKETATSVAPQSPGETSAVAAVEAAMRDAFPETPFAVAIHGYRFAYIAEGMDPFTFEISPGGAVLTVGM